jgi:histidyl-tRNA synthetase
LRRAGIGSDRAFDGRSMKAQMKLADRSGAAFVLIVGPDELADGVVAVRDLRGDAGQQSLDRNGVVEHLRKLLTRAPGDRT